MSYDLEYFRRMPGQDFYTKEMEKIYTRIISSESEWDSIRSDWDELFAVSPYAAPVLDFMWLRGWWRVYGPVYGADGLRIVTVWRASRLVGVLPLYLNRQQGFPFTARKLMFISTGEAEFEEICPDYTGLLCRAGLEHDVCQAVWQAIDRQGWDVLELLDVAAESPLLQSDARPRSASPFTRGVCPIADLAGGFESYLGRLSSNSRQQARRLLREGAQAGVRFEIVEAGCEEAAFSELVALHQQRWQVAGKPGVFAAERFVAFHRNLIRAWLPDGRVVLARLLLADKTVAVLYGFVHREKFDFYQSGVRTDANSELRSPGNLAHLLLMMELSNRGVTTYDFLRGESSYKQRLATREQALAGLKIWRRTGRAIACRCALLCGRALRKVRVG